MKVIWADILLGMSACLCAFCCAFKRVMKRREETMEDLKVFSYQGFICRLKMRA